MLLLCTIPGTAQDVKLEKELSAVITSDLISDSNSLITQEGILTAEGTKYYNIDFELSKNKSVENFRSIAIRTVKKYSDISEIKPWRINQRNDKLIIYTALYEGEDDDVLISIMINTQTKKGSIAYQKIK